MTVHAHPTADGGGEPDPKRRRCARTFSPSGEFLLSRPAGAGCIGWDELCQLPSATAALVTSYGCDYDAVQQRFAGCSEVTIVDHWEHWKRGGTDAGATRPAPELMPGLTVVRPVFPRAEWAQRGTMHAKLLLLRSPAALRVAISSANFGCTDPSVAPLQCVWVADVPRSADCPDDADDGDELFGESTVGGRVGPSLADFVSRMLDFPGCAAIAESWAEALTATYDFSLVSPDVAVVASVPGEWEYSDACRFGHLRLRTLTSAAAKAAEGGVECQVSSLAGVGKRWLSEFADSVGAQLPSAQHTLSPAHSKGALRLLWPSRRAALAHESLNGRYAVTCPSLHPELRHCLRDLVLGPAAAAGSLCHSKVYVAWGSQKTRDRPLWVVSGSHNLSMMAWGTLVVGRGTGLRKLRVGSYELSVFAAGRAAAGFPLPFRSPAPRFGSSASIDGRVSHLGKLWSTHHEKDAPALWMQGAFHDTLLGGERGGSVVRDDDSQPVPAALPATLAEAAEDGQCVAAFIGDAGGPTMRPAAATAASCCGLAWLGDASATPHACLWAMRLARIAADAEQPPAHVGSLPVVAVLTGKPGHCRSTRVIRSVWGQEAAALIADRPALLSAMTEAVASHAAAEEQVRGAEEAEADVARPTACETALSQFKAARLLLLDVDGTLTRGGGTKLLAGRAELLRAAASPGQKVGLCTNQGGVGLRKWMEEGGFGDPSKWPTAADVEQRLAVVAKAVADACGGPVAVYSSFAYRARSSGAWYPVREIDEVDRRWMRDWRKPGSGMLRAAASDAGIRDPAEVLFVGDTSVDKEAAESFGAGFCWAEDCFDLFA